MSARDVDRTREEVAATIRRFLEAGKEKELTTLGEFHAPSSLFSKFDESQPYTRQDEEQAFVYEQAFFANVSDYEYKIDDLRIDVVGGVAIATFYLAFTGVFVNNYAFEGKTVGSRSRVTMVLAKFGDAWKMVHEHFSAFPEIENSRKARS